MENENKNHTETLIENLARMVQRGFENAEKNINKRFENVDKRFDRIDKILNRITSKNYPA